MQLGALNPDDYAGTTPNKVSGVLGGFQCWEIAAPHLSGPAVFNPVALGVRHGSVRLAIQKFASRRDERRRSNAAVRTIDRAIGAGMGTPLRVLSPLRRARPARQLSDRGHPQSEAIAMFPDIGSAIVALRGGLHPDKGPTEFPSRGRIIPVRLNQLRPAATVDEIGSVMVFNGGHELVSFPGHRRWRMVGILNAP